MVGMFGQDALQHAITIITVTTYWLGMRRLHSYFLYAPIILLQQMRHSEWSARFQSLSVLQFCQSTLHSASMLAAACLPNKSLVLLLLGCMSANILAP